MEPSVPLRLTEIFTSTYEESYGFLGLHKRPVTKTREEPLMIRWDAVQKIEENPEGGATLHYLRTFGSRTYGSETCSMSAHVKETPEDIDKIVTAKMREIYGP